MQAQSWLAVVIQFRIESNMLSNTNVDIHIYDVIGITSPC
jgi:hypothetical protein